MPPHNIDEWAALITIMSILLTGLIGLINIWIIRPLKDMMDNLSEKFRALNETLTIIQTNVDQLEDKINDHEKRIYGLEIKAHPES